MRIILLLIIVLIVILKDSRTYAKCGRTCRKRRQLIAANRELQQELFTPFEECKIPAWVNFRLNVAETRRLLIEVPDNEDKCKGLESFYKKTITQHQCQDFKIITLLFGLITFPYGGFLLFIYGMTPC